MLGVGKKLLGGYIYPQGSSERPQKSYALKMENLSTQALILLTLKNCQGLAIGAAHIRT